MHGWLVEPEDLVSVHHRMSEQGAAMADWFHKRTIGMLPADAAGRWGGREALVFKEQRWTYREFDSEVDRVARALIGAGVAAGEHVGLWITNRPEFLFLFYAICKVGAVVVPLNTRYRTIDLDYALRQSDCATLISAARSGPIDYAAMVREVLGPVGALAGGELRTASFPTLRRVVLTEDANVPGACAWKAFLAAGERVSDIDLQARAAAVDPDGMAILMYTSGSTGHPKGVMLGHIGIRLCTERAALYGITSADVQLNNLPLFHIFSLAYVALNSILNGAKQVLTETFDADESLRLIPAERVTILNGYDTLYRDLLEAKRRAPDTDIGSLRVGVFASGLESVVSTALETQRGLCPIVTAYGMTETWGNGTMSFLDSTEDQRCSASGYPIPDVEIRVVDPDTGLDLPEGAQGEFLVRSYCNMIGYYKQPEATAEAIDTNGWLHTGDAGILRTDGHLRFVGRYKDMIKVGGENVAPAEIEQLLLQMPEVAQAAVVGCPHDRLQEIAAAFVVPVKGMSVALETVDAFCCGRIASYKIPRRLIVVDALPMTPSGKVHKHVLRERVRAYAAVG